MVYRKITSPRNSDGFGLGHNEKNSEHYATPLPGESIESSFDSSESGRPLLIHSEPQAVMTPMSESRLSVSALRLSLSDRPSALRAKRKSTAVTLTDILHDFLDTIIITQDDETKNYALNGLNCFLSTERDSKYYENLEKQLKPLRISFTRELHLSGAIIGITRNVIAERKLLEAQKTYGFCREKYWAILVVQSIEMTITTKESSTLSRRDIQTRVTNLIEEISLHKTFKADVEHVDASNQRDLSSNIITYLKFRVEHEELVDRLMKGDNGALKVFQEECENFLTSFAPLPRTDTNVEIETDFIVIPSVNHQFTSIGTKTYVEGNIKQRREMYKGEMDYFAPEEKYRVTDAESNNKLEYLVNDLEAFLSAQLVYDWKMAEVYDNFTLQELYSSLQEEEEKNVKIEDAFAEIKAPSSYYDDLQYLTQNAINQLPIGGQKIGHLDSPTLKVLISQILDLMLEDENKKNALDKAIESKNLEIMAKVLAYASHRGDLDRLLSLTLNKIAGCRDKAGFLLLIACTWLFAPQARGENLFNPSYVDTIRQLSYRDFSQNYFSTLFNPFNEPVLNSTELVEIARQLFDASNNLDHKNISMPAVVWQALKERQLPHERFEKLAHFYKKAIIHVTEKYNDDPELYETKRNLLLNTLYRYAKTEDPLEEAVVYIANALVASNSTLALLKPACFSGFFTLNKTQRLIWLARMSLPKEGSCPSLQLSSVSHTPAKQQIQAVLAKLQGTDQEQEERQKKCVCNDLMEEKQSWLPSFWSRSPESLIEEHPPSFCPPSTEGSIDMYDHPTHRPGSNEV